MKVLITGANGFVGKTLCAHLKAATAHKVLEYDITTAKPLLEEYLLSCDFIFHLAGVNRAQNSAEFMAGNCEFIKQLTQTLTNNAKKPPVVLSSSIQAVLDNPYGVSKRMGEEVVFEYGKQTGAKVCVYRFPNLFGKWCNPNYNSVVATFCHNIAHNLPIRVDNPDTQLTLAYIDDVIGALMSALNDEETRDGAFCVVPETHTVKLGDIADLLYSFKESRKTLSVPDMAHAFSKKLYATYLSCLPEDGFSYALDMKTDARGSFTEFLRTPERGQVSVNVSKPHITKGEHWHHTKNEKFLVVYGKGLIRFRKIGTDAIIDYPVSGDKLEVVDIPPGYTHNIINRGDTDMVTMMWASEPFDPANPDTYYEPVEQKVETNE